MTEIEQVDPQTLAKEERLLELLQSYASVAVAYSGGVDSTYLAAAAYEALGGQAHMVIADSPSIPRSELAEAKAIAEARGWRLVVLETEEFENEAFLRNDPERCYFCKSELFEKMSDYARTHDVSALAYGAIAEDKLDETRVGHRAAEERRVVAPLQEVGLEKPEIRRLSARRGLRTWNKASFACLSSRFPTGTHLTLEEMARVERAEEVLKSLGFRQYRARHHGDLCRVEIDEADFPHLLDGEVRRQIVKELIVAGYRYVTLDLLGYRTGSTAGKTSHTM